MRAHFTFLAISFFSLHANAQRMDLPEFKYRAETDARCVREIPLPQCILRIDTALANRIITHRAAHWARRNYYYPAIDPFLGGVGAVCSCSLGD